LQLPNLNFPKYSFRFKKSRKNQVLIFDQVRKKWLALTPEEWVRQNIISHLIDFYRYPSTVFKIETGLSVNQNKRRSDVLVYKDSKPFVLVECKSPSVDLTEEVLDQALNYNIVYKCPFVILTNGRIHKTIYIDQDSIQYLKYFPNYN
tara:strand:+ start:2496 stop:2939 length:444 start_codon:yes stop_codon:yes gene_type:complete